MPTTYAHDLFGKEVYKKLPADVREIIRANGDLYRIGLHGPDILFYFLVVPNPVTALGNAMHAQKAGDFFTRSMKKARETGDKALLAYLLGFGCHYLLDSACHPYVNHVAASGMLCHSTLEIEFDRFLMEQTGRNPYAYYPSCCIQARMKYARVIHQVLPRVSAVNIYLSLKMMRFLTNLMVADDGGSRRALLAKLLCRRKKESESDPLGHFMTSVPVKGSEIPVRRLKEYYTDEVKEAPAELMELYHFYTKETPLSNRWYKTYNG